PAVLGLARSPGLTPGSRMSSATLNPRTVPYELVRAIYGDSAEQVLKELTAWRSRADRTNPSGQRNFTTSETPSSGKIAWTTETQAWAFRLDLKTDNRQLAFWAVYELEPGIGWRLRTWHRIGDASK